jgi:hypothetical protein
LIQNVDITEEFSFMGYSSSPWEQATLTVNGAEVEFGLPLALIRGQANEITVEAPPEIARQLVLSLADAGGLTLQAVPGFDTPVDPVAGKFSWRVTSTGNLSGLATLVFYSHEVELPWELRSWVMSANLADEVDKILVNGVASPPAQIQFFRNEAQTVTLTYKAGSPLQGFPLQLVGTPLTGVQPANLSVTPADPSATHSWAVKSHTDSGTFQLELKGPPGTQGITLPVCKVMSHYLDAEVASVLLDGVPYPVDAVYLRGTLKTITLTYQQHSPLPGYPLELKAVPLTGLQPGDLRVAALSTDPHSWTVEAANRSGTFRLEVTGPEITRDLVLPVSKVLSANLEDEVDIEIDGLPLPEGGIFFRSGDARTLTLVPKAGSPMNGVPVKLQCDNQSGPDVIVESQPSFDIEVDTYRWDVSAQGTGTFQLSLVGKGVATPLTLPLCTVSSLRVRDLVKCRLSYTELPGWDITHQLNGRNKGYPLQFHAAVSEANRKSLLLEARDLPDRVIVLPIGSQYLGMEQAEVANWSISVSDDARLGKFSIVLSIEEFPGVYDELFFEVTDH